MEERSTGGAGAQRAGAEILAITADKYNREVLRHLGNRPSAWGDERNLELTPAGYDVRFVSAIGERWTKLAPGGGLDPDSEQADAALTTLIGGWITTIVHRLAVEPMTLTELARALDTMSREDVDANVAAMTAAGLLEARPGDGEGATYAVTDWLRLAIAPVAAAVRCERCHSPEDTPPVTPIDVEAGFFLTLPLLRLRAGLAGSCRLLVELPEGDESRPVGVMARVEDQRITACTRNLEGDADAWVVGDQRAWLESVIEGMHEDLRFGGDEELARELVEALHVRLFRI